MNFLDSAEIGRWLGHRLPACKHLFIASPFVTEGALEPIVKQLEKRDDFRFTLVTNVDVMAALMGALDIDALAKLLQKKSYRGQVAFLHDPNLHAKVVMVDQRSALVGSANLTLAGTAGRNIELATEITGAQQIQDLVKVIQPWSKRPEVTRDSLDAVRERCTELEGRYRGLRAAAATGLPRIVGGGDDVVYFQNLQLFLSWVRDGTGGTRAVKKAVEYLRNEDRQERGSKTPETDLHFVATHGLVRFKGSRVRKVECTRDGTRVLAKSGRRFLFDLLWRRHPELRWAGKFFVDLGAKSVTREQLKKEAPGWVDDPEIPTGWLRSLELVCPHGSGKQGRNKLRLSLDLRRTWIQSALDAYGEQ